MLLGTIVYVGIFLAASAEASDTILWPTIIGWNVLLLVVAILVIIDSVRKVRAGKTRELTTGVLIAKLAAIPFFVITFALLALAFLGGAATLIHGIGIAFLGFAAIGTTLTYLTMLSTSIYGWASVVQLRRERRIDKPLVVLYTFLLLIFVWDILAAIMLFADSRRGGVAAPAELDVAALWARHNGGS
jgi:hypothetical protein